MPVIDLTKTAQRIVAAAGILLLVSFTAAAQQRKLEPEAARLIELLDLSPGTSVADIGAGSGEMTVEIARQLGKGSRVFGTDINQDRLREIAAAAKAAELTNVTVLEGHADRTNLVDGCCDAIFVRHVYHHFKNPPEMNASIRRSLKPGGRFAVMDFPPDKPGTGTVPPELRGGGDTHGVTPETVMAELKAAGFVDLQLVPAWHSRLFLVYGRSPK
jgi:ubiquinone/menaquinone biosynthesis C-methylase UbiE